MEARVALFAEPRAKARHCAKHYIQVREKL